MNYEELQKREREILEKLDKEKKREQKHIFNLIGLKRIAAR